MKLTNLPKEGERILLWGIIIVVVLALLSGCGSLTTLQSCDSEVGIYKEQCVEAVEAKQHALTRNERIYDRR